MAVSIPPVVSFAGVVLCGGKSSRMGLSKAMLPFGPELMLQRVVRLLSQVVRPVVVVAAPEQVLPELPVEVIVSRDDREGRGPLQGLLAGVSALEGRAAAAYATSCDVPLLVPAFVRHMLERLEENDAAVPVEDQFYHPLAAVYRLGVLPHIRELLAADQLRPAFLFDRVKTCRVPIEELKAVDPELNTLKNLNQPPDYLVALAEAGFAADPAVLAALGEQRTG